MSRTRNILLAAAAALTTVIATFIGLPAIVYQANEAAFTWPLANLLVLYWPCAALFLVILIAPAAFLPSRQGRYWSATVLVIAVYVWAHGSFQTHDFGSLDGLNFDPTVPLAHTLVEIGVIIAAIALLFVFAFKAPKVAAVVILLPATGLLVEALPQILATPPALTSDASKVDDIARLSPDSNVIVVLLDAMQSDVFEDVVDTTPSLARALDGFTFYPDTLGAASSTYLTMPTLHSGATYSGDGLQSYFETVVGQNSVLTKAVAAGYRGVLVNKIQRACPDEIECITSLAAMSGDKDAVVSEASMLIDSVLFRVAPLALKNAVYNGGNWIVQNWTVKFSHRVVEGNEFLRDVAERLKVSAETPQLRFFHLFSTHPPFVLNDRCAYTGYELAVSRDNIVQQVSCALDALASLITAMKDAGVYDQSHIFIVSDTGLGIKNNRAAPSNAQAAMMGQANPTFAIKPAGTRGAFKSNPAPLHIGDFGATLCDLIESCSIEYGHSALSAESPRVRIFNRYAWKHEYWYAETIPNLIQYRVLGPLNESSSWFPGPFPEMPLSSRLEFTTEGEGRHYLGAGWHTTEAWGTWSGTEPASIFGQLPASISSNIRLSIAANGFVLQEHPNLRVVVKINDTPIETLEFNLENPSLETKIHLNSAVLGALDGILKISFENDTAVSPAQLGLSEDQRALGMGLKWIAIEAEP